MRIRQIVGDRLIGRMASGCSNHLLRKSINEAKKPALFCHNNIQFRAPLEINTDGSVRKRQANMARESELLIRVTGLRVGWPHNDSKVAKHARPDCSTAKLKLAEGIKEPDDNDVQPWSGSSDQNRHRSKTTTQEHPSRGVPLSHYERHNHHLLGELTTMAPTETTDENRGACQCDQTASRLPVGTCVERGLEYGDTAEKGELLGCYRIRLDYLGD